MSYFNKEKLFADIHKEICINFKIFKGVSYFDLTSVSGYTSLSKQACHVTIRVLRGKKPYIIHHGRYQSTKHRYDDF